MLNERPVKFAEQQGELVPFLNVKGSYDLLHKGDQARGERACEILACLCHPNVEEASVIRIQPAFDEACFSRLRTSVDTVFLLTCCCWLITLG